MKNFWYLSIFAFILISSVSAEICRWKFNDQQPYAAGSNYDWDDKNFVNSKGEYYPPTEDDDVVIDVEGSFTINLPQNSRMQFKSLTIGVSVKAQITLILSGETKLYVNSLKVSSGSNFHVTTGGYVLVSVALTVQINANFVLDGGSCHCNEFNHQGSLQMSNIASISVIVIFQLGGNILGDSNCQVYTRPKCQINVVATVTVSVFFFIDVDSVFNINDNCDFTHGRFENHGKGSAGSGCTINAQGNSIYNDFTLPSGSTIIIAIKIQILFVTNFQCGGQVGGEGSFKCGDGCNLVVGPGASFNTPSVILIINVKIIILTGTELTIPSGSNWNFGDGCSIVGDQGATNIVIIIIGTVTISSGSVNCDVPCHHQGQLNLQNGATFIISITLIINGPINGGKDCSVIGSGNSIITCSPPASGGSSSSPVVIIIDVTLTIDISSKFVIQKGCQPSITVVIIIGVIIIDEGAEYTLPDDCTIPSVIVNTGAVLNINVKVIVSFSVQCSGTIQGSGSLNMHKSCNYNVLVGGSVTVAIIWLDGNSPSNVLQIGSGESRTITQSSTFIRIQIQAGGSLIINKGVIVTVTVEIIIAGSISGEGQLNCEDNCKFTLCKGNSITCSHINIGNNCDINLSQPDTSFVIEIGIIIVIGDGCSINAPSTATNVIIIIKGTIIISSGHVTCNVPCKNQGGLQLTNGSTFEITISIWIFVSPTTDGSSGCQIVASGNCQVHVSGKIHITIVIVIEINAQLNLEKDCDLTYEPNTIVIYGIIIVVKGCTFVIPDELTCGSLNVQEGATVIVKVKIIIVIDITCLGTINDENGQICLYPDASKNCDQGTVTCVFIVIKVDISTIPSGTVQHITESTTLVKLVIQINAKIIISEGCNLVINGDFDCAGSIEGPGTVTFGPNVKIIIRISAFIKADIVFGDNCDIQLQANIIFFGQVTFGNGCKVRGDSQSSGCNLVCRGNVNVIGIVIISIRIDIYGSIQIGDGSQCQINNDCNFWGNEIAGNGRLVISINVRITFKFLGQVNIKCPVDFGDNCVVNFDPRVIVVIAVNVRVTIGSGCQFGGNGQLNVDGTLECNSKTTVQVSISVIIVINVGGVFQTSNSAVVVIQIQITIIGTVQLGDQSKIKCKHTIINCPENNNPIHCGDGCSYETDTCDHASGSINVNPKAIFIINIQINIISVTTVSIGGNIQIQKVIVIKGEVFFSNCKLPPTCQINDGCKAHSGPGVHCDKDSNVIGDGSFHFHKNSQISVSAHINIQVHVVIDGQCGFTSIDFSKSITFCKTVEFTHGSVDIVSFISVQIVFKQVVNWNSGCITVTKKTCIQIEAEFNVNANTYLSGDDGDDDEFCIAKSGSLRIQKQVKFQLKCRSKWSGKVHCNSGSNLDVLGKGSALNGLGLDILGSLNFGNAFDFNDVKSLTQTGAGNINLSGNHNYLLPGGNWGCKQIVCQSKSVLQFSSTVIIVGSIQLTQTSILKSQNTEIQCGSISFSQSTSFQLSVQTVSSTPYLNVVGNADLAGVLNINLGNSVSMDKGQSINFIKYNSHKDKFSKVNVNHAGSDKSDAFGFNYQSGGGALVAEKTICEDCSSSIALQFSWVSLVALIIIKAFF